MLLVADRDGDGHIEPKEIKRVMKDVGVRLEDEQIKEKIRAVDKDNNGMVGGQRTAPHAFACLGV